MSKPPHGASLYSMLQRRPRLVYLEGYVFVWDRAQGHMGVAAWMPPDGGEAEMVQWLRKTMPPDKRVWVYRVRMDLVAEGKVADLTEEVFK